MPECFTWSQTSDKSITGLCSMELLMETVRNMRNGCAVCVRPTYGNACGCPDGEVDGLRKYRLIVEPGVSGSLPSMADFYGSFVLTNNGVDCQSTVQFGDKYWTVTGTTVPTLSSGKLWRIGTLYSYDSGTGQVVSWSIDQLPACSNRASYSTDPVNVSGFDEWFTITLYAL